MRRTAVAGTLAVLVGVASLLWGCARSEFRTDPGPGPDADPRMVASADGVPVTASWFEQTYIDFLVKSGANDTLLNRWAHLDFLLDSILLAGEFEASDDAASDDFKRFVKRVELEELGSRYFEVGLIDTMAAPTERQIRTAFQRSKEKAVVRHLYFTSPDEARESWKRLQAGKPFLEEARDVYGLSRVDSAAGYLGEVGYWSVDDAFAEAAWRLSPGAWSQPVRTRFGWHIILLEQRTRSPLLSESEFQTARAGISSQYRLRRRRLEGDGFVRQFMEAREVQVNAPTISALSDLIQSLDPAVGHPLASAPALQSETLAAELDEGGVLATYEWDGDREAFTAGQYAFWLESLPQREARERTAASVGRALRNELLARAADEVGLRDAEWETEVRRRVLLESAARMRRAIRTDSSEVAPERLREAYDRLRLDAGRHRARQASFRAALYPSRAEAEEAVRKGVEWTISYKNVPLQDVPGWGPWVASLPLDDVSVVGRRDDWAVIHVLERVSSPVSREQYIQRLSKELAPRIREYDLVRSLRERVDVVVDTSLFESLSFLGSRPEPSPRASEPHLPE
ncbi:MAG: hypothetical protein COV99_09955 [Bacteroidetes bacterium CG12_big_fil_rev_8_21_14_0_65_60_17]|nr:MAG: hypothetical protein COV99_09955 [Bacteroidetes bacterium CG12_big_fil_rev_8_21_14_0_65_60_17]